VKEKLPDAAWLVLDNLKHRWPYTTNMTKTVADEAYAWCESRELGFDCLLAPRCRFSSRL